MKKKYFLAVLFCFAGVLLFAEEIKTINLANYVRSRYNAGERDIVLPDGKVKCYTMTLGKEFKDVTIRGGKDTMLISTRLTPLFFFNGCKNVTVRDFKIDYDPLPFTQGTITRIDYEKNLLYYRLHDGYPRLTKPYIVKHPMFFDARTRRMSFGDKLSFIHGNTALNDSEGVIKCSARPQSKVGDMLVLNFRNECVFKVRGMTENLTIENITMYSGPAGVIARMVKGRHIIRNCRAVRGEKPAGAVEERLLSLSADAVNYATGRKGPIIEGNEFEFIGDDSINLHGRPFFVVKAEPEKGAFIIATGGKRPEYPELIFAGDKVRMLAKYNFALLGSAVIKKFEPVKSDTVVIDPQILSQTTKTTNYTLFRVYVDGRLPEPGTKVDFPAINMPDFVIRNNCFRDHRARGMRIMARNGIIENNRIERLEHQAISLGGEYGYWDEGGWVEDILVRGNVIDSVCLGGSAYRMISYSFGAICTFVHIETGNRGIVPCNRGVVIEKNRINNCGTAGIHLASSDGAVVRGNVISNVNWADTSEIGSMFGLKYDPVKKAIGTIYSKNAVIENNEVK